MGKLVALFKNRRHASPPSPPHPPRPLCSGFHYSLSLGKYNGQNKFMLPKGKGAKELGINIYSPGHTQRIIYKIDNQRGPTV